MNSIAHISSIGQWPASLDLGFSYSTRGTQLSRCRHYGPLYVQKPFYPEGRDLAHCYLLHPPGGLVSGDALKITVEAEEKTKTLITTPGAARIYRARENHSRQVQTVDITVKNNASVEWFPMETIVYDGADAELHTTIQLNDNSHFVGWEITCLGLPAGNKPFNDGSILQSYRIEKNGLPLFIDRLQFSPKKSQWFTNPAGMFNHTCSGFFMAGPFEFNQKDQTSCDELTEQLRAIINENHLQKTLAVTWVGGFCMVRYLGDSAFAARDSFIVLWEELRPVLLKRQAKPPGIWRT